jgi:hypothetical protein
LARQDQSAAPLLSPNSPAVILAQLFGTCINTVVAWQRSSTGGGMTCAAGVSRTAAAAGRATVPGDLRA